MRTATILASSSGDGELPGAGRRRGTLEGRTKECQPAAPSVERREVEKLPMGLSQVCRRLGRVAGSVQTASELLKHAPLLVPVDPAGNGPQISLVEALEGAFPQYWPRVKHRANGRPDW